MIRALVIALVLLAAGIAFPAENRDSPFPAKPQPGLAVQCVVKRVIDGDTAEFEIRRLVRIRLLNCWAPESRTTNAEEKVRGLAAKQHLIDLAKPGANAVVLIPAGYDLSQVQTLNRLLGYAWVDGQEKSLNELQVESGHAKLTKAGE